MKPGPRFLAIALFALSTLAAQAQTSLPPDLNRHFSESLMPGMTREMFLVVRRTEFAYEDADGDGAVSPADLVRRKELAAASLRAARLSSILRADLDGDGMVSREEMEKHGIVRVDEIMRFDSNQDGKLDWQEMLAYARAGASPARRPATSPLFEAIMALDEKHEGHVTWATYQATAEAFFNSIDTDHDGRISHDEIEANRQRTGFGPAPDRLRAAVPPQPTLACTLPPAPQGAKVVLFEGQHGQGISTVAIGSQDMMTYASSVTIEPGAEPLYLVLAAYGPMIWQFDGAVDRVAKAVLVALDQADATTIPVGVTGLAKEKVAFGIGRDCVNLISGVASRRRATGGDQYKLSVATFKRLVGAEPTIVTGANTIWKLALPSGHVAPAEYHPDDTVDPSLSAVVFKRSGKGDFTYVLMPGSRVVIGPAETGSSITILTPKPKAIDELREDFARWNPAGLVRIDAAQVVANRTAVPYEVLPGTAGLIQLMESGAIEKNRQGEFLVKRKIRWPAGLPGMIDAKFLILKGVPLPDGDPGRSRVASEDTGDLICKGRCP